jgi:hemoglobin
LVAAVLLAVAVVSPARTDEAGMSREAVNAQLYASLREVINRGAELYNQGDAAGCFHVYQGALLAVRPALTKEQQRNVEAALGDATREADVRRRAWVLRNALDGIRTQVRPTGLAKEPPVKELPMKEPSEKEPPAKAATLWQRLGGEAGVRKVVDDWFAIVAEDEKADFTRGGKFKPNEEQLEALKKAAVAFVSQATGGPLKYTGKSMKVAHKGMEITNEQFDATVADLVQALEKNEVPKEDIAALIKIVSTTRKDIVEAKAPEQKKPDEKEKEAKKPEKKDE